MWVNVCGGVLVICVLVFTVFCIVCTVFFYCFVYVYLFLFVLSVLLQGLLPLSENSIAVSSSNSSTSNNNNSPEECTSWCVCMYVCMCVYIYSVSLLYLPLLRIWGQSCCVILQSKWNYFLEYYIVYISFMECRYYWITRRIINDICNPLPLQRNCCLKSRLARGRLT
jgi:hypothetical protein